MIECWRGGKAGALLQACSHTSGRESVDDNEKDRTANTCEVLWQVGLVMLL
jgi:hypothetical protein